MNFFLFGGSGFIGTHLVDLLHDRFPSAGIFNLDIVACNHRGKSTYIACDVRNKIANQPFDYQFTISPEDIIFNLAAIHRTPGHADREYFETNIRGAENITEFADKYGIRKIVFTSSIAPYGASEELMTEETLPTPNTPYGISKLVAEKIHTLWQAKDHEQRQLTILRPGVVFGKGENGNFTRLYQAIRSGKFFYPGRKDTIKACIYVKDLVSFILHCLSKQGSPLETYNCTYSPAFTIEEICNAILKVTGLNRHILQIPGGLLMTVAGIAGPLGGKYLGIHPARVKKLMVSTNICGKKMSSSGYRFRYDLEGAIADWYHDNENRKLE